MKKYLFALLLALTTACIKPAEPPAGTISQEQMVQILTDIHLAEAKTGHFNLRSPDSSQVLFNHYEKEIFRKYGVDTATYRRSYRFYLENTDYIDEIYQAVVDSLSLRDNLGKVDE